MTFKINDIFETQKWRIESFNENYKSYSEVAGEVEEVLN